MDKDLAGIVAKHAKPSDLFAVCPKCGTHGAVERCPFASDDEIIAMLAMTIVEEFSTRDAKMLVRLFCTEGARIALELHEALRGPEE